MPLGAIIEALVRVVLVLLFLPFSALDKILDFKAARVQAASVAPDGRVAAALILAGLGVEIFMSLGVVTGLHDRLCAFVLAGYCALTALMWKRFWTPDDFWSNPNGRARGLFWDFLKNVALAGGFLLITFGTDARTTRAFLADPLSSTHPYASAPDGAP